MTNHCQPKKAGETGREILALLGVLGMMAASLATVLAVVSALTTAAFGG